MVDSGLRRGEVVSLSTGNINLINNTMLIIGKGNKERLVPFGEETKRYIRIYLNMIDKKEKYFFQNNDGKPITNNTIKLFFQKLKVNSEIYRLHPHLLRHTFATMLLNEGCNIKSVQELLGHSSLGTTGIYTHLTNDEVRLAYMKAHPRA